MPAPWTASAALTAAKVRQAYRQSCVSTYAPASETAITARALKRQPTTRAGRRYTRFHGTRQPENGSKLHLTARKATAISAYTVRKTPSAVYAKPNSTEPARTNRFFTPRLPTLRPLPAPAFTTKHCKRKSQTPKRLCPLLPHGCTTSTRRSLRFAKTSQSSPPATLTRTLSPKRKR